MVWAACTAVALLVTTAAQAQTVVVNETLHVAPSDSRFSVQGGTFTASGWRFDTATAKITVDFGHGIDDGTAGVDVTSFDPSTATGSNPEFYCSVFSTYAKNGVDHNGVGTTSAWEMMAFSGLDPTRTYNIKVSAWGPGAEPATYLQTGGARTTFDPWQTTGTYHLQVTWNLAGTTYTMSDTTGTEGSGTQSMTWYHPAATPPTDPVPNLRYLYLGQNFDPCDPILGATWSNLKVTENPDPCAGHCTDAVLDCGEIGTDCGEGCTACTAPDAATPPDAATDATKLDASVPHDAAFDAMAVDARVRDAAAVTPDGRRRDSAAGPVARDAGCDCLVAGRARGKEDVKAVWVVAALSLAWLSRLRCGRSRGRSPVIAALALLVDALGDALQSGAAGRLRRAPLAHPRPPVVRSGSGRQTMHPRLGTRGT